MQLDVITIFPEMFEAARRFGITGRAFERGIAALHLWQLRDFTQDGHRTVDDRPYGGGPGMVMLADPLDKALTAARQRQAASGVGRSPVVLMSPQGEPLTERVVQELKDAAGLTLICGRYEGIDERFIEAHVDRQISIGDYVLSGGELPAMVLIDALVRRLPGVMNDAESPEQESFVSGLLDWPHYTRPEIWQGQTVPPVLLSGNHAHIARWRLKQALKRTQQQRPDLMQERRLSKEEKALLAEIAGNAEDVTK